VALAGAVRGTPRSRLGGHLREALLSRTKSWHRGGVELIDAEPRARRLARTVVSDIVLYNEKQLAAGADLSGEIAEGRSLFRSRVAPSLHWIFDDVLAGTPLGKGREPSVRPIETPPVETALATPPSSRPPAAPVSSPPTVEEANVELRPVEPEPPRVPSSAPPPSAPVVPPAPEAPRAAPVPEASPVVFTAPEPVAAARPRSQLWFFLALLMALAIGGAVGWFMRR
jgi:hypothetical protein